MITYTHKGAKQNRRDPRSVDREPRLVGTDSLKPNQKSFANSTDWLSDENINAFMASVTSDEATLVA